MELMMMKRTLEMKWLIVKLKMLKFKTLWPIKHEISFPSIQLDKSQEVKIGQFVEFLVFERARLCTKNITSYKYFCDSSLPA